LSVKYYALDDRVVRMCTNSSKSMCELHHSRLRFCLPSHHCVLWKAVSMQTRSKWFAVDRSEADQSISGHKTTVLKNGISKQKLNLSIETQE
jgi:hypothetical protein